MIGGLAGVSAVGLATAGSAHAANGPTALFAFGSLTVVGSSQDDVIAISRDAAGTILVNGGAVPVFGGTPTVANTRSISLIGMGGHDVLRLDEANGALPKATIIGGSGNDTLGGGSAGDLLIGQSGNDTLDAKGGTDRLFGGLDNDTLTGGDADDQAFGEAGDDAMIWNPGDDTDLNEGGAGVDTTIVNGGGGAEQFAATANGTRVRFDRLDPAPFAVDMGSTEKLALNANGGDDSFATTGDLAPLVAITVDGGAGNDNLLGSNGVDVLLGGDGNDFADGQQGNDVAFLGAGDDTFQWDPGDGSDVVEGQDGNDAMLFNGVRRGGELRRQRQRRSCAVLPQPRQHRHGPRRRRAHRSQHPGRRRQRRPQRHERHRPAGDGHRPRQPGRRGTPDADADTVTVNATEGDDVVVAGGANGALEVQGLAATLSIVGAAPANDRIVIHALGGDDVLDASGVAASTVGVTADMGVGDDVAIGGDGNDTLLGSDGDDVLLGGPGTDTLDGGAGDNVLIDGENIVAGAVQGEQWLDNHTREEGGRTVLDTGEKSYGIPVADLAA